QRRSPAVDKRQVGAGEERDGFIVEGDDAGGRHRVGAEITPDGGDDRVDMLGGQVDDKAVVVEHGQVGGELAAVGEVRRLAEEAQVGLGGGIAREVVQEHADVCEI